MIAEYLLAYVFLHNKHFSYYIAIVPSVVVILLQCPSKIATFTNQQLEAIAPVLNMMANDWLRSKSAQDRDTMMKSAGMARIIITFACCIMGVAYAFIIIVPVFGFSVRYLPNITEQRSVMPIPTYYAFDITPTPQYEITFALHTVSLLFAMSSYTGIDNFIIMLVFHICGQLNILCRRLDHMNELGNHHVLLKTCVLDHIRLLRAIDIVEDTYNIVFLAIFLCFSILFAFNGFLIIGSLVEENDISMARFLFLVSTVVNLFAQMCLHCAVGEILMAHCDKVNHAVYNQRWYTLNPSDAKNLIPLIIKSRKPVYLTAGKVFPMTMATFCNLVKTSAGYLSVLLTV